MTDNDDYSDDFEDEEHSDGGGKRGGGDEADAGDRKSPEAGGASDGVSEDLANILPPSDYPDEPRNAYGGGADGGGGGGGGGEEWDGASTLRPSAVDSTAEPPRLHSSPSRRVAIGSPDRQRGGGEDRRRPRTAYRRSYDGSDPNAIAQINWKRGKQIGMGSFGAVHLALNKDDGSLMAVKEMDIGPVGDSIELKKVRMEVELMRELEHPNIVRYLGTDVNSDERRRKLYIFCEWVAGGSLQGMVDQFGPLSHTVVSQYTRQMLEGLRYLHDKCIIHRDIKPGNVLVDDVGTNSCVGGRGEKERDEYVVVCCSTQ